MNYIKLISSKKMKQKFAKGYPLLTASSILNPEKAQNADEGSLFKLYDEEGKLLGSGYIGRQNKGLGWVLENGENGDNLVLNGEKGKSYFGDKLKKAKSERDIYFKSKVTNAFRVFNGEGDGLGGLTIDYFGEVLLVTWYSRGIYKYRDEILGAMEFIYSPRSIYEKKRFGSEGTFVEEDSYVSGEILDFPIIVTENSQKFAINLNDGAMVGVFLDQRDVRKRIRDRYSKGKDVLNTFSYTGAFSVFAAAGGAVSTTSVDLANRSKPKTMEQFQVNDISLENNSIVVDDVFDYFAFARKKNMKFDLVILDPPSFAKSKKRKFSAEKNYGWLLGEALSITRKGGVIVASTNCGNFNMKEFKSMVENAFKENKAKYQIVDEFSLPRDFKVFSEFKEGNYLKVLFLHVI